MLHILLHEHMVRTFYVFELKYFYAVGWKWIVGLRLRHHHLFLLLPVVWLLVSTSIGQRH